MEAVIAVVVAALGLLGIAYVRGRRSGTAVAAQAEVKARVEVATEDQARTTERRAARGSDLARQIEQIHTETKAKIASKRTDRAAAAEALAKARAWDDASTF